MTSSNSNLECRILSSGWENALYRFFQDVVSSGSNKFFHPHPFTFEVAAHICEYKGLDLYYALVADQNIIAYGMLRGWDQGFTTPSLGIIVHSRYRELGIGKGFMHFLHMVVRMRGATQIRLRVYQNNHKAISLYTGVGYKFDSIEEDQLVGIMELL